MLCHLPPFITVGMAVSARCRKVNDALLVCAGIVTAYGVIFWQVATNLRQPNILESSAPGLPWEVFRWPLLPYLSGDYPPSPALLTIGWRTNLAADLIWTFAVTAVCLLLAIRWSRLSRRATVRRKVGTG